MSISVFAQQSSSGWLMMLATPTLDSAHRWRGWLEVQPRWDVRTARLYQTVLRPGLGYHINGEWSVWGGYAWIETSSPRTSIEHRLWQQLNWVFNREGSLRWRIEERFFPNGTELRLRAQIRTVLPLAGMSIILADEVFANAAVWARPTAVGYDQNRLFGGVMLLLPGGIRAEVGYMNVHYRNSTLRHVANVSVVYQP
ncbi:MAG: DUF2490 domain-containing protein [Bacteroidota bacterium]|nr:DUF2490 domain-containing protein [Candidatus Kapabacteria bacterium]MCX7937194.1 DUF2490 domain-containing protein [Chlorobiota bacterium]MDW8075721.1 DUF2490 domain-containing protein [Bacteroidota bacterium]